MKTFDKIVYTGTAVGLAYYGFDMLMNMESMDPAVKEQMLQKGLLGAIGGASIAVMYAVVRLAYSVFKKIKGQLENKV